MKIKRYDEIYKIHRDYEYVSAGASKELLEENKKEIKGISPIELFKDAIYVYEESKEDLIKLYNKGTQPIYFMCGSILETFDRDMCTHIAKKLNLLTPPWREGCYNSFLLDKILNDLTLNDILHIEQCVLGSYGVQYNGEKVNLYTFFEDLHTLHYPSSLVTRHLSANELNLGFELVRDFAYYAYHGDFVKPLKIIT